MTSVPTTTASAGSAARRPSAAPAQGRRRGVVVTVAVVAVAVTIVVSLSFGSRPVGAPDVILAAQSGLTEEDYGTLSEIAPVVALSLIHI